jgi:hypothetical protein
MPGLEHAEGRSRRFEQRHQPASPPFFNPEFNSIPNQRLLHVRKVPPLLTRS